MGKKRALLVAINDYPGVRNDLDSCLNDLSAMEQAIVDGFGFQSVTSLKDGDATIAKVESAITALVKDATPGDQLLFFYSGHGTQIASGTTMEEALYLYDGAFADDKLVDLCKKVPPGVLTVVLDSCFSGGMEKCLFALDASQDVGRAKYALPDTTKKLIEDVTEMSRITSFRPFGCFPIESKFTAKALTMALSAVDESDESGQPVLNALLITASSENELASASTPATMGLSAFTFCLLNALSEAKTASVNFLVDQANRHLKSLGFRQTPMVKSNPTQRASQVFLSGTVGTKGFGFSGGGSITTPFGSGGIVVGGETKSTQKVFGIDDVIIIPAIAAVVTAAINANRKSAGRDKIFGIDDAILIPVIASVITTAINAATKDIGVSIGGSVTTPFGSGAIMGAIGMKAPELAEAVVQHMRIHAREKIFGIDDAILIPAIASIISSAVAAASKGFSLSVSGGVVTPLGAGSFVGGVGMKDVQVPGLDTTALLNTLLNLLAAALSPAQKCLPYSDSWQAQNLFDLARRDQWARGSADKAAGTDDALLMAVANLLSAALAGRK